MLEFDSTQHNLQIRKVFNLWLTPWKQKIADILFLLTQKAVDVYPEPDPLAGMEQLEFYGQRAWRPGKLSAEPPDPDKEKLGIQALQYQEKYRVHHSVSETQV